MPDTVSPATKNVKSPEDVFEYNQGDYIAQLTYFTLNGDVNTEVIHFICYQVPADLATDPEAKTKIARIIEAGVKQSIADKHLGDHVEVYRVIACKPYKDLERPDSYTVRADAYFRRLTPQ